MNFMNSRFVVSLLIALFITLPAFASQKVKVLSVFPYENVIESVPLYDEGLAETQCTTEIIPNVGFVEGEDTPHSFTQASANGVDSTLATLTGGGMVETDQVCTRNGSSDNVKCPHNAISVLVTLKKHWYPYTLKTQDADRDGKSDNWKFCDEWGYDFLSAVAKVVTYVAPTLVQGICTEKPITLAIFTEGSCAKAVQVTQNATIECPKDLTGEVPFRNVTLEQLVTKGCVGDTIKVRGSGYVYPKNPNQAKHIIKSRFAVIYQKPGKVAATRIVNEEKELIDPLFEGEFKEEREFTFDKPGTYTFRFWVYNRGAPVGLGVSRIVEVVDGCLPILCNTEDQLSDCYIPRPQ